MLIVRVLDENFPSLTSCCLSVRKLGDPPTDGDGELCQFILKGVWDAGLKHGGTSHISNDLLKICVKMGASWSALVFR